MLGIVICVNDCSEDHCIAIRGVCGVVVHRRASLNAVLEGVGENAGKVETVEPDAAVREEGPAAGCNVLTVVHGGAV